MFVVSGLAVNVRIEDGAHVFISFPVEVVNSVSLVENIRHRCITICLGPTVYNRLG